MSGMREIGWWMDPVPRAGPEAMAVDEWLLKHAEIPLLRVYPWAGDWASVGYFGEIQAARASISGVNWVRRWTGGGAVDHRADWTYSVIFPHTEPLARARGALSYGVIHEALGLALAAEGLATCLSGGEAANGDALCFSNPVGHDLIGDGGAKIAGAGQRRTKSGLLHQGSVAAGCADSVSRLRAQRLADGLASSSRELDFDIPDATLAPLIARYSCAVWTERR